MDSELEFVFSDSEDARAFMVFLMNAGIIEAQITSEYKTFTSRVRYGIDLQCVSVDDSIQYAKDFFEENGIEPIDCITCNAERR